MIDWTKILFDWRQATVPDSHNLIDKDEYYHDCSGKDHVVVTAGDSWTYGEFLDEDKRLDQVYGRLISKQLDADWINLGCRGRSNSWMLHSLLHISTMLPKHYTKITVIVTMTENGRDFETSYMFPHDYRATFNKIGNSPAFYNQLLDEAEQYWITLLTQIQENLGTNIIVGHNFVWHDLNNLNGAVKLQDNWIEKIADYQERPRPLRAKLVSAWIFDLVAAVVLMVPESKTAFKQWALGYIDQAGKVTDWLANSDLNVPGGSKHPKAKGHEIWADYILTNIKN